MDIKLGKAYAGAKVLSGPFNTGEARKHWEYKVECQNCGNVYQIKEPGLVRKHRQGICRCAKCGQNQHAKKSKVVADYGVPDLGKVFIEGRL